MMVDCYARVSKKKIYLYFIFKTSFLELDWLWSYDKDIRFGCESPSNTCWFLLYVAIHHQNRNSKLESSLFASYSSFILSSIIISSFILFGFGIIFIFFFYTTSSCFLLNGLWIWENGQMSKNMEEIWTIKL